MKVRLGPWTLAFDLDRDPSPMGPRQMVQRRRLSPTWSYVRLWRVLLHVYRTALGPR
jgi:hypothetical protein